MSQHGGSTNETYRPTITEQQGYWDERWERGKLPNNWQTKRGESILALLRPLDLNNPLILDLGCATGWFTAELSKLGEATGVDLSEGAIKTARTRFPKITFIAGNLFEMPLLQEHFDVVVSQEVIAHVEDQDSFIEKLSFVLKPRGYLVITTVNKFVMDRLDWGHDPKEHIKQWLNEKGLKQLLEKHFDVLHSTTALPMGDRGILRFVNSPLLNSLLGLFVSPNLIENWKGRLGFGYTRIMLARKKS